MFNFLKGFTYAFNGLVIFFRHERNGRIQLCIAVAIILCSWWFHISCSEWITILICIAAVLAFEMLNSAIEKLCNLVHPTYHPAVKTIKDISAGAVLWVSVISAIIGVIIFLPRVASFIDK